MKKLTFTVPIFGEPTDPTGNDGEPLVIEIQREVVHRVRGRGLDEQIRRHSLQAHELSMALFSHIPSGVIDAVLADMLRQRASISDLPFRAHFEGQECRFCQAVEAHDAACE